MSPLVKLLLKKRYKPRRKGRNAEADNSSSSSTVIERITHRLYALRVPLRREQVNL